MNNIAKNLEDFYEAERLTHAATDLPGVDMLEARLFEAGRDRLAALDAFGKYVMDLADPVTRWRALCSAAVTLRAWMIDEAGGAREFRSEMDEKRRQIKKMMRQAKRSGDVDWVKKGAALLRSIERTQSADAPILRKMVAVNAKINASLQDVTASLPAAARKRPLLKARPTDVAFDAAVDEVMDRTAVVRAYLAR